jgi:hypothetical protein
MILDTEKFIGKGPTFEEALTEATDELRDFIKHIMPQDFVKHTMAAVKNVDGTHEVAISLVFKRGPQRGD